MPPSPSPSPSPSTPQVSLPSAPAPVRVAHAVLGADGRLTAEVGGRRVTAQALLYRHAGVEEVLVVWLDGLAHEFRWVGVVGGWVGG